MLARNKKYISISVNIAILFLLLISIEKNNILIWAIFVLSVIIWQLTRQILRINVVEKFLDKDFHGKFAYKTAKRRAVFGFMIFIAGFPPLVYVDPYNKISVFIAIIFGLASIIVSLFLTSPYIFTLQKTEQKIKRLQQEK